MTVSLYDRLGGYDAIAMFATKLVGQAQTDEKLGRFWANRGEDAESTDAPVEDTQATDAQPADAPPTP